MVEFSWMTALPIKWQGKKKSKWNYVSLMSGIAEKQMVCSAGVFGLGFWSTRHQFVGHGTVELQASSLHALSGLVSPRLCPYWWCWFAGGHRCFTSKVTFKVTMQNFHIIVSPLDFTFVVYFLELCTYIIQNIFKTREICNSSQGNFAFHFSPVTNFQGKTSQRVKKEISITSSVNVSA